MSFGDVHIFRHWKLTKEPAILLGTDVIGVVDQTIIDYRAQQQSVEQFFDYWERVRAPCDRVRVACGAAHKFIAAITRLRRVFSRAAAASSMPLEVATAILQDEATFVDLKRSVIWFGEEKLMLVKC
jgi:hypothetical protein